MVGPGETEQYHKGKLVDSQCVSVPRSDLAIIENVGLKCVRPGPCGKGFIHPPALDTHTRFSKECSMPHQKIAEPNLTSRKPQAGGAES